MLRLATGLAHRGQFLDLWVRGSEWGQSDLLRELREQRVGKHRAVTHQLVDDVTKMLDRLLNVDNYWVAAIAPWFCLHLPSCALGSNPIYAFLICVIEIVMRKGRK